MAKKMGVPLGMLHAGVNMNDITDRVMKTGAFHKSPAMIRTLSEAINIQIPYNFERLLFYLTDGNHDLVRHWMEQVDTKQKLDLDRKWLAELQTEFGSARVTDEEMCTTIRKILQEHDYLLDPNTAVAFCAAEKLGYSTSKTPRAQQQTLALLSTASPCKFQEAVTVAIGEDGWIKYRTGKDFPARADTVMLKEERSPTIYRAEASLEESQVAWERKARQIVADLSSKMS